MSKQKEELKAQPHISRRDFARRAVVATATAAVISKHHPAAAKGNSEPQETVGPPLSPEAEVQYQAILRKYGSRLSGEQTADIKRLLAEGQKGTDAVRGFTLKNSDEPAMILRLYQKEGINHAR